MYCNCVDRFYDNGFELMVFQALHLLLLIIGPVSLIDVHIIYIISNG